MSDETTEKKEYPRPSLTADNVVIALGEEPGVLRVLFVRRARDPFAGAWAFPGGFVEPTETVAQAAARELAEETALRDVRLVELGCFSRPGRDPRGWVVSVAHLALVPVETMARARAGDDAAATAWLELHIEPGGGFRLEHEGEIVPPATLAFDHADILSAAVQRLHDRVGELAFDLLPRPFTLAAARRAFEAILGEPIEPTRFERVLRDDMVRAVPLSARPGDGQDLRYVLTRQRRSPWIPER
jgi:8-oxo-dGTP diphosphatase